MIGAIGDINGRTTGLPVGDVARTGAGTATYPAETATPAVGDLINLDESAEMDTPGAGSQNMAALLGGLMENEPAAQGEGDKKAQIQQEIARVRQEISQTDQEIGRTGGEISNSRQELKDIDQQISQARAQKTQQPKGGQEGGQDDGADQKVAQLEQKKQEVNQKIEQLENKKKELEAKKKDLEAKLKELEAQLKELEEAEKEEKPEEAKKEEKPAEAKKAEAPGAEEPESWEDKMKKDLEAVYTEKAAMGGNPAQVMAPNAAGQQAPAFNPMQPPQAGMGAQPVAPMGGNQGTGLMAGMPTANGMNGQPFGNPQDTPAVATLRMDYATCVQQNSLEQLQPETREAVENVLGIQAGVPGVQNMNQPGMAGIGGMQQGANYFGGMQQGVNYFGGM